MKEYKAVSKWLIILSVLLVATGLVMLIWPNLTISLLGNVLGMGMLIVGIAHIIIYFTKDHFGTVMHMDLTVGVLFASLGAFMLMHADFVSVALPFGIGILLLIGGISKIQYALDMKRIYYSRWYIMLIFAIILILFGILMLYNPFRDHVLVYVIGAALLLDGLLSILSILLISHRTRQIAKGKYTGPVKGKAADGNAVIEEQPHEYAGTVGPAEQNVPVPYAKQPPVQDSKWSS